MNNKHNNNQEDILECIRDIISLANSETDENTYINTLCKTLVELRGYHGVWIALFDENKKIDNYAYANVSIKIEQVFHKWNQDQNITCINKALNINNIQIISNTEDYCSHCLLNEHDKNESALIKTININNRPYGVMCVLLDIELSNNNEKLLFETLILNIELALQHIGSVHKTNKQELRQKKQIEDMSPVRNSDNEQQEIDEIRKDKEVFKKIFRKSKVIKLIVNPQDNRIIDCNEEALKFYGHSYEQLTSLHVSDLNTCATENLSNALKQFQKGTSDVFRFEHTKNDSITKFIEVFPSIITINSQPHILLNIFDITEKIKQENELIKSEARYNSLFQNMINGVAIYSAIDDGKDFKIIDFNESAKKITKKTKEEILYKSLYKEFHQNHDSKLFKTLQRVYKTGKPEFIKPHYKKNHLWEGWQENFIYKLPSGELVEIFNDVTSREESIMSLNLQKEDFKYFFNSLKDIVVIIDMEGNIIGQNLTALARLQFTKEEIKFKPYYKLYQDRDQREAKILLGEIIRGVRDSIDIPLQAKNKSLIPVTSYTFYGHWQDKNAIYIINIDKSDLKKSEEKYRQLAENSTDIIWTIDLDLNHTYLSPSIEKILGYTREELKGVGIQNLLTKESLKNAQQIIQEKIKKFDPKNQRQVDIALDVLHKDGSVISTESTAKFIIKNDKIIGIQGSTRDITERRVTKELLVESKQDLQVIFDNAPAIMILLDENSKILKINKKGYENAVNQIGIEVRPGNILNCVNCRKDENICGSTMQCSKCILKEIIQDAIKNNIESFKKEVTINSYDEQTETSKTFLVSSSIISNQPAKKVLLTIDDITDRKTILNELQKAKERAEESDKLKSIFMENISHEIRTPMNSIMGFAQLLPKYWENKEKRSNYINYILDNSNQLLRILDDIIDISTMDIGDMIVEKEVFELNELLEYVYDSINKIHYRENVEFRVNMPIESKNIKIFSDKTSIIRVLNNLIENAFKFTHEGYIEFGYYISNNKLNLFVKDSGIGINKKYHDQIFERFRQIDEGSSRSYGGIGLGLAICKQLAELMNGKIILESTPEEGSKFTLTIPYNPVIMDNREIKKSKIIPLKGISANILIVEDEISNFKILEEVISENLQARLFHALNGKEAIKIVKEQKIDLILMDIKMPVMDGYEATRIIRTFNKEVPIIAQTAYALQKDELKAKRSGLNNFIHKPIDIEILLDTLFMYLKKK